MEKIAFLTFVLCGALQVYAQVKLSGKVTDDGGRPIEFASVRIDGTAIGTNTDTEGAYALSVPARDTVMVVFSCIGYSDVKRRLVKPKGEMTLNAKLYEKTQQLKDLEVTEFKKQTNQMQTIDATKLKLTPDASATEAAAHAPLTTRRNFPLSAAVTATGPM